ncbi:SAM-dependent methyltransferase [Corynebacterium pseudotuberculosis 267]|uniref:class I SAM-dependent DNA methyltransferase n=1 Tax=Corynebacterium pseudotuberculosis TaxID=1719 RepID=UPI0002593CAC|nr:class I SAM-dependent methyltransferase [Corynebacterium pseudotuberculosis]AFH51870.1 SAM-dependent methyltransferase [Corynebacterium pseudotuberculosis 267]
MSSLDPCTPDVITVSSHEAAHASQTWWDSDAQHYHDEHQEYLSSFYWCPEMLSEKDANLLGNVRNKRVLEIGCGSAPCSRWLAQNGVGFITGFDLSLNMLRHADQDGTPLPLVNADAQSLPSKDASWDIAFSAFGAFPFVPDITATLSDVSRVLTADGRLVFSVNHPMRWIFPDDPGQSGLIASIPYFQRSYIEEDEEGRPTYVEFQRTIGDWVRALIQTGFSLQDIIEPEWPDNVTRSWGQWSPLRGKIFPGTAIFIAHKA